MFWLWVVLSVLGGLVFAAATALLLLHLAIIRRYLPHMVRIFLEKPLFIIPRGEPVDDAEDVRFTTRDGLTLRGCYLRTPAAQRQGVILFGLEFGSNRWSCVPYCRFLREAGFDVFTFEPRGQGDSDVQPGYEPLQWVTEYEVRDFETALAYLKSRADADARGVGFFGLSKGGSAGVLAAKRDGYVRCFVTDGIFATHTTMVPYMRKWIAIYSTRKWLQTLLPDWYYRTVAGTALRRVRRERGCRFPRLERALVRLGPRPLLMIHGGADNYIKPEMAQALFDLASGPKEFWQVEGAKHNQAFHVATGDYQRRVLTFFEQHLGARGVAHQAAAVNGHSPASRKPEPLAATDRA